MTRTHNVITRVIRIAYKTYFPISGRVEAANSGTGKRRAMKSGKAALNTRLKISKTSSPITNTATNLIVFTVACTIFRPADFKRGHVGETATRSTRIENLSQRYSSAWTNNTSE